MYCVIITSYDYIQLVLRKVSRPSASRDRGVGSLKKCREPPPVHHHQLAKCHVRA